MQVNLTGFMDKHGAAAFMSELWKLLLSAQATVGGVPAEVCSSFSCLCSESELMGTVHCGQKGRIGEGSEGGKDHSA